MDDIKPAPQRQTPYPNPANLTPRPTPQVDGFGIKPSTNYSSSQNTNSSSTPSPSAYSSDANTASSSTSNSVNTFDRAVTAEESVDSTDSIRSTDATFSDPTINQNKKSHRGLLITLLILVLLAAVGAGGYFYWMRSKHTSSAASSTADVKKDIAHISYVTTDKGWETFYPAIDYSTNYEESNSMLFEGLVRFENKTQIVPLLSTGWTNPNDTTWVFKLKKGVTFHTGRAMTAPDVKASFEAAKGSTIGQLYSTTIKSVEATDPYTVTIITDGPDPTLLNKLTNYYVYDTKSGKANDPINGTGPFVIKPNSTPKDDSLELVAFDQYYGGRPHVRSFSFIGLADYDHGKSYGENKADIMTLSGDKLSAVGTRKFAELPGDETKVFMMPLNTLRAGSPLQNIKVRQAMQYALDSAALAKVRETESTPASQLVPRSIPGFDSSLKPVARDVAKAKQLLGEAGYAKGTSLTLTYYTPAQVTAQELARQMAEAGITLKLDPQSTVKELAAKAQGGKTDAYFLSETSDLLDASDILSKYANTPNYKNQTVVDLLNQAQSTMDASKRLGYLKNASRTMANDLGVIPIYAVPTARIIYNPTYVMQRDIANDTVGVYFSKVYAK